MSYNGILPIFKEENMTSHDVVAIVRRTLSLKQVGHTGTLDPMARGVLPICIGTGTRIIEYLDMDFKTYHCKFQLGILSDTLDIWGQITEKEDEHGLTSLRKLEYDTIKEAVESFSGLVEQTPPVYSAIKVNGKRLYSYAREGKKVDIPKRTIYISSIELLNVNLDLLEVEFRVICTKGTYIRSLCRDIGEKLGTFATMTYLSREATGDIVEDSCVTLEQLKRMNQSQILELLLGPSDILSNLGEIRVDEEKSFNFINGGKVGRANYKIIKLPKAEEIDFPLPVSEKMNSYLVYGIVAGVESLLGIGKIDKEKAFLKGDKVLFKR